MTQMLIGFTSVTPPVQQEIGFISANLPVQQPNEFTLQKIQFTLTYQYVWILMICLVISIKKIEKKCTLNTYLLQFTNIFLKNRLLVLMYIKLSKMKTYSETEETLEALKNLSADKIYVSFNSIFNEIKRIRNAKGLSNKSKNLKGRVRRSLVYDKNSLKRKEAIKERQEDSQVRLISIALMFPKYEVKSKTPILLKNNGNIIKSKDVEENSFKLIEKNNNK